MGAIPDAGRGGTAVGDATPVIERKIKMLAYIDANFERCYRIGMAILAADTAALVIWFVWMVVSR